MLKKKLILGLLTGAVAIGGGVAGYLFLNGKKAPETAHTAVEPPLSEPPVQFSAGMHVATGIFERVAQGKVPKGNDPFAVSAEDALHPLAGGAVDILGLDGEVLASGRIADDGSFSVPMAPVPRYIVRGRKGMLEVSYGVYDPDAIPPAAPRKGTPGEAAAEGGHEVPAH